VEPKGYIDLGEAAQVGLQQDLLAGHDLFDADRNAEENRNAPAYYDNFAATMDLKRNMADAVEERLQAEL